MTGDKAAAVALASCDLPPAEVLTTTTTALSDDVWEGLRTVVVHSDPTVTTVRLIGVLDMRCAPGMARTVDQLLEDQPRRVVLDVSRLRGCTPRGLASILGCYQRLDVAGIPMTLRGANARLRLLAVLYGLDELLPMEEGLHQP